MVKVQVVFAEPELSVVHDIELPLGSTVKDALDKVRALEGFQHVVFSEGSIGIFGRLIRLDKPLNYGDRIEIYRSLQFDPKEIRRNKAK